MSASELVLQNHRCQRILNFSLYDAFQRASPEVRVKSLFGQKFPRGFIEVQANVLLGKLFALEPLNLDVHDLLELILCERVKRDHFVNPVNELRPEMTPDFLEHLLLDFFHGPFGFLNLSGGDVTGHDNDGVLEVYLATVTVGQLPFVHDLQQDVVHLLVRLFDFVQQHDRVRAPAHRLGQLSAFLVSHVSRRGPDQAADGVFLHELRHVQPHHGILVIKQEVGKRPGQLRLADPCGPEEQEGTDRTVRILQVRTCPSDGF